MTCFHIWDEGNSSIGHPSLTSNSSFRRKVKSNRTSPPRRLQCRSANPKTTIFPIITSFTLPSSESQFLRSTVTTSNWCESSIISQLAVSNRWRYIFLQPLNGRSVRTLAVRHCARVCKSSIVPPQKIAITTSGANCVRKSKSDFSEHLVLLFSCLFHGERFGLCNLLLK